MLMTKMRFRNLGIDMVGDLNTAQSPSEVEQAMSAIIDMFDPSQINAEA